MSLAFLRAYPPAQPPQGSAYWLPFRGDNVLVKTTATGFELIQGAADIHTALHLQAEYYLGTLHGLACLTGEVEQEFVLPAGWSEQTQRTLFGRIGEQSQSLIGYATQILHWQHISRYCPVSAHATESLAGSWGRICPSCGYTMYPPSTPAILVLVHDGERMLLTHKPGWGSKRYSCIAGFVEPGESLEECVQREIYEEVGLQVTDIAYIGSQPWPFPHQLMVGYTARYLSGDIHLDGLELDDARWFTPATLPELPPPQSLAHRIITTWIDTQHTSNRG